MEVDAIAGPSASPDDLPLQAIAGTHDGGHDAESIKNAASGGLDSSSRPAGISEKEALHKLVPHVYDQGEPGAMSREPSDSGLSHSAIESGKHRSESPVAGPSRGRRSGSSLPQANQQEQSRHGVPPGWNGPIPKADDPEDIAPVPHLNLAPGSQMFGQPVSFPTNRHQWRYDACVPASEELPWQVYKLADVGPRGIHWSWQDRSPFTQISRDAMEVTADKGFRSVRANVGVREGCWYCEVEILPPEKLEAGKGGSGHVPERSKEGPHVRLGWARREASLNAPAGVDAYSYGFRDKTGERVTIARPTPYGKPWGPGDVIGMYIKLPPARQPDPSDPLDPARIRRVRVPIRFKGALYYESMEYPITKEMEFIRNESFRGTRKVDENGRIIEVTPMEDLHGVGPIRRKKLAPGQVDKEAAAREKLRASLRQVPTLEASEIAFFVNGEPQGVAFRDLFDYRPLRRSEAEVQAALKKGKKRAAALGIEMSEDDLEAVAEGGLGDLNNSRENYFDDGATGYFPFVSLYGGGRVRINPGPHFKYPPPGDIHAVLHPDAMDESNTTWRPLSDRYEEWLAEQHRYDLEEEPRAQMRQLRIAKVLENEAKQAKLLPSKGRASAGQEGIPSPGDFAEVQRKVPGKKAPRKAPPKRRAESDAPSVENGKSESPATSRPSTSPAPAHPVVGDNAPSAPAGPQTSEVAIADDADVTMVNGHHQPDVDAKLPEMPNGFHHESAIKSEKGEVHLAQSALHDGTSRIPNGGHGKPPETHTDANGKAPLPSLPKSEMTAVAGKGNPPAFHHGVEEDASAMDADDLTDADADADEEEYEEEFADGAASDKIIQSSRQQPAIATSGA